MKNSSPAALSNFSIALHRRLPFISFQLFHYKTTKKHVEILLKAVQRKTTKFLSLNITKSLFVKIYNAFEESKYYTGCVRDLNMKPVSQSMARNSISTTHLAAAV